MNKESELEEMTRVICPWPHKDNCEGCSAWAKTSDCTWTTKARKLQKAGYGNVKEAVREFCEELKESFKTKHLAVMANVACNRIDELFKEFYGKIEGADDETAT